MSEQEPDLAEAIRALAAKLDQPRKRDLWDIVSVLTTFLASGVLAGMSLYFSTQFQRDQQAFEQKRQAAESELKKLEFERQTEVSRSSIRVAELEAVTKLIPQLASQDVEIRTLARQILATVQQDHRAGKGPLTAAPDTSRPSANPSPVSPSRVDTAQPEGASAGKLSIIDRLASVALAASAPLPERVRAASQIADLVRAGAPPEVKARAEQVATSIVKSDAAPELQSAAADILALVRQIRPQDVPDVIRGQSSGGRAIDGLVIHHTVGPTAAQYRGESVLAIARFQLQGAGWNRLSWHYAIAPDGSVWLGMPLDRAAAHVRTNNKTTVSVTLILNGDKEDVSPPQGASLAAVLRALVGKLGLNRDEAIRFHRDFDANKTCPGQRITKQSLLALLNSDS